MPTPEERIAARLHQALDHHERARISTFTAERGLAVGGPDAPDIVLTVEDVARIDAAVADSSTAEINGAPRHRTGMC